MGFIVKHKYSNIGYMMYFQSRAEAGEQLAVQLLKSIAMKT